MDNLNCCFFCLNPISDWGRTPEKRENVRRFFEMVQRHIGGNSLFPFKQKQALNQVYGDIWPCLDCLSALETFNELYDQLKVIELRANIVLAKIGDIMGDASKVSVKVKTGHDDPQNCSNPLEKNYRNGKLAMYKLNWARKQLKLKCRSQLAMQFPIVTVKRCKLNATIQQVSSDGMEPNSYLIPRLGHGIKTILFAMTSFKVVLQLSLINDAEFWDPIDLLNYHEQLSFRQNEVRKIVLAMASLTVAFKLALLNANSAYPDEKPYPTKPCEIPIDDDEPHQQTSVKTRDPITAKVAKLANDVLECHRCQKTFDNFSSLKYHWLQCDSKKPPSLQTAPPEAMVMLDGRRKRNFEPNGQTAGTIATSTETTQRRKTFACAKCPKICTNKQLYKNHLWTHSDPSTWPYSCPVCEKRFIVKHSMYFHMMTLHKNDPKTKATIVRLRALKDQRKKARTNGQQSNAQANNYTCQQCGKVFKFKQAYNYHIQTHLSPENWKFCCSVCGKRFIAKPNLESHFRSHTKEKQFSCSKCEKKFSHSASIRYHMMMWH